MRPAGARTPELHLNPGHVGGVGRPRRDIVDQAATRLGVNADDLHQSPYVLAGAMQEIVEYLKRLRETL
jgi:hypothetical protein